MGLAPCKGPNDGEDNTCFGSTVFCKRGRFGGGTLRRGGGFRTGAAGIFPGGGVGRHDASDAEVAIAA